MAKDLVRTRNYVTRFIEMKTHLNAVSLKMQVRYTSQHRECCEHFIILGCRKAAACLGS